MILRLPSFPRRLTNQCSSKNHELPVFVANQRPFVNKKMAAAAPHADVGIGPFKIRAYTVLSAL